MNDEFENFLEKEISKSKIQFSDNGFSDQVIFNLPKRKKAFAVRETIITFSAIISAFVFILINGLNLFLSGLLNLSNSLIHLKSPNYEFVIVLIAFSLMSLLIPYIELKK